MVVDTDMLEQLNYQLKYQIPEKVAWLDISVDDLLVVQVLQAQEDVAKAFPENWILQILIQTYIVSY